MTNQTLQIEWKTKAQLEAIATYLYSLGYKHWDRLTLDKLIGRYFQEKYHWVVIRNDKTIEGNKNYFDKFKTITLQELFDLEQPETITVKLNDSHSAIVSKDGIKVGCQSFTHDSIKELWLACEKMKGQQ